MRKFYHNDFFINRLVEEWLTHHKLIVGCDVDDTIIPYNSSREMDCKDTVDLLKECATEGVVLILNTARSSERFEETLEQVHRLGLNTVAINKTPEQLNTPFSGSGKIYANIFLDDRGGLSLAKIQLRKAFEIVKHVREQETIKTK